LPMTLIRWPISLAKETVREVAAVNERAQEGVKGCMVVGCSNKSKKR